MPVYFDIPGCGVMVDIGCEAELTWFVETLSWAGEYGRVSRVGV